MHASRIQFLTVPNLLIVESVFNNDEEPVNFSFSNLKEIRIRETYEDSREREKNILRSILKISPHIQKVMLRDEFFFDIVPEEYYGLAGQFELRIDQLIKEPNTFQKFLEQKPKLKELFIHDDFDKDAETREAFEKYLGQLLQCCAESLEVLDVFTCCFPTLTQLSKILLSNLASLSLYAFNYDVTRRVQLWDAFTSIDADRMMPQLEEVELLLELKDEDDEDPEQKWPNCPHRHTLPNLRHSYNSVRRLQLSVACLTVNML